MLLFSFRYFEKHNSCSFELTLSLYVISTRSIAFHIFPSCDELLQITEDINIISVAILLLQQYYVLKNISYHQSKRLNCQSVKLYPAAYCQTEVYDFTSCQFGRLVRNLSFLKKSLTGMVSLWCLRVHTPQIQPLSSYMHANFS